MSDFSMKLNEVNAIIAQQNRLDFGKNFFKKEKKKKDGQSIHNEFRWHSTVFPRIQPGSRIKPVLNLNLSQLTHPN